MPCMDPLFLRALADHMEAGDDVVVLTVVDRQGSAPATPGQKMLVTRSGRQIGTVGGGNLELQALEEARRLMGTTVAPQIWHARLGPDLGMCCGGSAQIVMESWPALSRVWLVGAGHVSHALAPHLVALGYQVHVSDIRDDWLSEERFPGCRLHALEPDELPFVPRETDLALVMTHDHQWDEVAIEVALNHPFGLVGGVGSRAKAARIKKRLKQKGVDEDLLDRVEMPLGLSIGARLPAEIAVAIAARVVAHRQGVLVSQEVKT